MSSNDPWSNAEFAIGFSHPFLNFLGVWPHNDIKYSKIYKIFSIFRFYFVQLLCLSIILIPQTTKLYFAEGDLDLIIDILSTAVLPVVVACMKIVAMRYNSEALSDLLDQIYADWQRSVTRQPDRILQMLSNARSGRRIAILCIGVAYSTSAIFFVLRLVVMSRKQEQSFLMESHFPAACMLSPWFETLWFLQGVTTFVATTAYAAIDGFFAVLVMHLCGQFQQLTEDFCRLEVGREDWSREMRKIVARHNELNKLSHEKLLIAPIDDYL
uniref:Odorant receptor n=1 Tax=Trichogramma kaykai TaxID=54128 RepID=A0ABD2XIN7_9HYME